MTGRLGELAICTVVATLVAAAAPAARSPRDLALDILPPGESGTGGVHASDQLKLYDAPMRWTNRPTFRQVISFADQRKR